MMLGYNDMQAILKAMNKAYAVCNNLDIPIVDNFIQTQSPNTPSDFKMTRFACYLTVMNGNISNQRLLQPKHISLNWQMKFTHFAKAPTRWIAFTYVATFQIEKKPEPYCPQTRRGGTMLSSKMLGIEGCII